MAPNQQIKMGLAREIWSVLTMAMSETTEIEVTTCVGGWDLDYREELPASSFQTQIDLFERTVEHKIDRKLIDNPAYRELQRWHIEQVRQRQDSLTENLADLEAMRQIVIDRDFV